MIIKIHKILKVHATGIQRKVKSLPLCGHGRSLQAGKGLRVEDNPFIGKNILSGMVEKSKAQGSKVVYESGFPLQLWQVVRALKVEDLKLS